jgi:hypothetical protein
MFTLFPGLVFGYKKSDRLLVARIPYSRGVSIYTACGQPETVE